MSSRNGSVIECSCGGRFASPPPGSAGRTKIYGGIVILHRLRDREPELAAILRCRNSAPFVVMAEKAAFQEHAGILMFRKT